MSRFWRTSCAENSIQGLSLYQMSDRAIRQITETPAQSFQ